MRKKQVRRRRSRKGNNPWPLLLVMLCVAVGVGYVGVDAVVVPWMEHHTTVEPVEADEPKEEKESGTPTVQTEKEEASENTPPRQDGLVEGKIDAVESTAYAVQLGSFSTEEAAARRVAELNGLDIPSEVQKRDNAWKVISGAFGTKEEARAAAVRWREIVGDAFVVEN